MGESLNLWVQKMLKERGWSANQLAQRAGLSGGYIRNVLSGRRQPGAKFYRGIAKAFDVTMDQIELLDQEGIEPGDIEALGDPMTLKEAYQIMSRLTSDQQKEALRYLRYLRSSETAAETPHETDDTTDDTPTTPE